MELEQEHRLPACRRPPVQQDRIANWFRNKIIAGKLQPGERLPPRIGLAEKFKTSTVTVQHAMNQLMADGFVQTCGPKGSFVAEALPHKFRIGLVFHPVNHDGPEWSTRWDAMLAAAKQLHREGPYHFTVYAGIDAHMDAEDCRRLQMDIERRALAGLFLDVFSAQALVKKKFDPGNIPVIGMEPNSSGTGIPLVTYNPELFYDLALKRLKAEGCRNIACISLAESWDRLPRMKQFFKKHGLVWHDEWMQGAPHNQSEWAGQCARLLFGKNARIRPDALIVSDDNLALPVANALRAMAIRVPKELRVISLCNYPVIPPVNMGFEWAGSNLVDMLRDTIDLFARLRQGLLVPEKTYPPYHYFPE